MPAQDTTQRLLADRYALKELLGRGGMGVVWRADDRLLQRQVAIKEVHLPDELSGRDRDAVQARVLREARAAARLGHPSVVTVYDVLQEGGTAYIVMELVEGRTLADVVEEDGALEVDRVAGIGLDVLGALERAHAEGIVHRDVKPANVMITSEGRVKLADFGIASLKGDPKLTQTGMLLGSPSYMAPEQAQDEESGPAADLWALGATLYFAVEGEPPFDRGKPIPTLAAVVYDEPRPPRRAGSLGPTLMSLLSKAPHARPSGAEVAAALRGVVEGRSRTTSVAGPPARTKARPATGGKARDDVWTERREDPEYDDHGRRRAWPVVATAAVVVLLLAGALVYPLLSDGRDAAPGRRAGARAVEDKDRREGGSGREGTAVDEGDAAQDEGGADEVASEDPEVGVPAGWETYTDPEHGYTVSHPPGWQITPDTSGPNSIDIEEPGTGTYMRIAWTDTPKPDPQAEWERYSQEFAASHDNYETIQITPTTFKGYEASLWEFTWSEGDADLHAYDLAFVTGDYGYALNFVAREANWESSKGLFEAFKASFEPPS